MYVFLLLLSVIGVLLFVRWLRKMIRFRKILNKYPGRHCSVLLGDVGNMSLNRVKLFRQIREHAREFPDGYRLYASYYGSMNFIAAEDVEVVLSSSKHIEKSAVYLLLHPWLGTGLLTSSGHKWSQRRKILTPAFHFDILRRFITIFGEHNYRLIADLKIECNNAKTNIIPIISKHALNIICETAMGISMNSGNEKMKDYQEAIYGLGGLMVARTLRFWLYKDFIYYLTSSGQKQKKYLKTLHQFTTDVIKERERTFNESDVEKENEEFAIYSKKRFSMLDLLILAKRQSGDIDDSGIREEVDTFMFEGHDTVASALSFTLLMLANHKDIQNKVRAEIDEILQDSSRQPNYQDLQKMHYLSMCIKESLRLYPSVPFISRHIDEDVSIRGGKYIIPEGCLVHIHIYDLHRNPKIFPEPNKFDPDRFLPENIIGRHPYAYIPFSAGPRNCIGQKFAMLEMKSVISSILRNYELEPIDTAENLVILMDIVLRPKAGIHVKFKPRVKSI